MKAPSPLLGFNNNVRHKGRVFHIQTEDSGVRHPHIITHLFADGGRILKTIKTSYAEHIGQDRLAETVRAMMQDQHKAMFIALRDGQYDYMLEETGKGSKPRLDAVRAGSVSGAATPPVSAGSPAGVSVSAGSPAGVPGSAGSPSPAKPARPPVVESSVAASSVGVPVTADAPPAPPLPFPLPVAPAVEPLRAAVILEDEASRFERADTVPPPLRERAPNPPGLERGAMQRPAAPYAPTEPARRAVGTSQRPEAAPVSHRRTGRPTLDVDPGALHRAGTGSSEPDLDLDALERAAAEAQAPIFQQIQNLPPPPAAVLAGKRGSAGGYSSRTSPPPPVVRRVLTPGGRPAIPSPNRYAPSRPASIFATTRPNDGASIFGEDLISEKSLDEVILGYLAEDLDGPPDKK